MNKHNDDEILNIYYEGDRFAMIPYEIVRNPNISSGAKELYCIIKSYITISGFTLYKTTILKCFSSKNIKTFDKYWKELKDIGCLEQIKQKKYHGRFSYNYILYPYAKHLAYNEISIPQNLGYGGITTPQILDGWKNGVLNNTDINNTDNKNLESKEDVFERVKENKDKKWEIDGMLLTDKQIYDINSLILLIGTNELWSTKEDLFRYLRKLYDPVEKIFKNSKGKKINSLYGYVKMNFEMKAKQDEEEYKILKQLAENGDSFAKEAMGQVYKNKRS